MTLSTFVPAAALVAAALSAAAGPQNPPVNPQARALAAFADRLKAYLELHEKIADTVPPAPVGATPEQLTRHADALYKALHEARRGAHEGDIFTPDVAPQFRSIIRRDLQSRDITDAFAAMQEVPRSVAVHVNDRWPADAPRATVPPRVLANLYTLPEDLEYRFIERHLVLLDIDADLIVDIVRDVVPSLVRRRL